MVIVPVVPAALRPGGARDPVPHPHSRECGADYTKRAELTEQEVRTLHGIVSLLMPDS